MVFFLAVGLPAFLANYTLIDTISTILIEVCLLRCLIRCLRALARALLRNPLRSNRVTAIISLFLKFSKQAANLLKTVENKKVFKF